MALSGYNCINCTNWYNVMINKVRKIYDNLRHIGRADDLPLASNLHARNTDIPSSYDLFSPQSELKAGSLQAVVKHLVVLFQTTFIVHLKIQ